MTKEEKFIMLFDLGFINSDGSANMDEVYASARRHADVMSVFLTEVLDEISIVLNVVKCLVQVWMNGEEYEFAALYSVIYKYVLGMGENPQFEMMEELMDEKMYEMYCTAFVDRIIRKQISFLYETAQEDILVDLIIGGIAYERK